MPKGGLRRSRPHPSLAQVRGEGVPQGVNVEGSAPVVNLGDAGKPQVAVEDLDQFLRHDEERRIKRQSCRDRPTGPACIILKPAQLIGQPVAQVRGQVRTQSNVVPFATLFAPGVEGQEGNRPVEAQLSYGKRFLGRKSKGKLPVVWTCSPGKTSWAMIHTIKRHGGRVEEVVVIELNVPRSWLSRSRRGLWYSRRAIPPERLASYSASLKWPAPPRTRPDARQPPTAPGSAGAPPGARPFPPATMGLSAGGSQTPWSGSPSCPVQGPRATTVVRRCVRGGGRRRSPSRSPGSSAAPPACRCRW